VRSSPTAPPEGSRRLPSSSRRPIAEAEMRKGPEADKELIAHALNKAEESAIAVAPYLEPKLAAKSADRGPGEGRINIVLDAIDLAS
jgi:hypothetical protein